MPATEHDSIDLTGDDSDDEGRHVLEGIDLPDIGEVPESAGLSMNGFPDHEPEAGAGDEAVDEEQDYQFLPTLDGQSAAAGVSDAQNGHGHAGAEAARDEMNIDNDNPLIAPDEDFEITGSSGPGPSTSAAASAATATSPRTAMLQRGMHGNGYMHPAIMSMYQNGMHVPGMQGIAAPAAPGPGGYGMYAPQMQMGMGMGMGMYPNGSGSASGSSHTQGKGQGQGQQVHPPPLFAHHPSPAMYGGHMGAGMGMGMGMMGLPSPHYAAPPFSTSHPPNQNLNNMKGYTGGSSAQDAIDITSMRVPTPPPSDIRQTICLGALQTTVSLLGSTEAAHVGGTPAPDARERYEVITFREAEFLRVKLKYRVPGKEREGEPWTRVQRETIQINTPLQTEFIGDLELRVADVMMEPMRKGLARLEGYMQRVPADSTTTAANLNLLVFTLNANRNHITNILHGAGLVPQAPMPPYNADRHLDKPVLYVPPPPAPVNSAWMQNQQQMQMMALMQARYGGGRLPPGMGMPAQYYYQQNRVKTEDLEKQVKDDVFKALEEGIELDQCDPGVLIKTTLFPHQRKALTFMLLREQDKESFKEGKKQHEKYLKRVAKKQEKALKQIQISKIEARRKDLGGFGAEPGERVEIAVSSKSVSPVKQETPLPDAAGVTNGDEMHGGEPNGNIGSGKPDGNGSHKVDDDIEITDGTDFKKNQRDKSFDSSSLWEPTNDSNGKPRKWKNKLTGETKRTKTKPAEGKSAILADDMGLGKTLSIISLIAATRASASKWAKVKLETDDSAAKPKVELDATGFKGRVFGMPDVDDTDPSTAQGKKRKREETDKNMCSSRQSRIKTRSKGTLLISPMSTINNWREQLSAHWNGTVELVGGEKGIPPKDFTIKRRQHRKGISDDEDDETDDFDVLRVYIYHGPSRIPDPKYLAQFDLVITSYNVLALEYSKMCVNLQNDDSTPGSGETSAAVTPAETPIEGDAPDMLDTGAAGGVDTAVEAEIREQEFTEKLRRDLKKKGKGGQPKKAEMSPLQAVDWFRVVLDEAHYIKTPSTVASKAACYLSCDRRIALSGTPIQNKIEDIWALFKFLRLDPVDNKETFNSLIGGPCKVGSSVGVARLQLVMRACTLRRTKDSKDEAGNKVLELPQRHDQIVKLQLTEEERKAYDEAKQVGAEKLEEYQAQEKDKQSGKGGGKGSSLRNVLQHLLRLRQICDHVELAAAGEAEEDYDGTLMDLSVAMAGIQRDGLNLARAQSVFANRKATDGDELQCSGCNANFSKYFPALYPDGEMEPLSDLAKLAYKPFLTKCLHIFCPTCFKQSIYPAYRPRMKEIASRPCSDCNVTLKIPTDVIEVSPPTADGQQEDEPVKKRVQRKRYVRAAGEDVNLSTKLRFLHGDLMRFSRKNPGSTHYMPAALDEPDAPEDEKTTYDAKGNIRPTKSIIFSQWTSMLDRVSDMLDFCEIKHDRLDGTMSLMERSRAMAALADPKKGVEVLLVSLRAGGVGLNLTAANRVYIMEPYWNPAVEAQAIDRIHRMGQTRPVTSIRLIVEESVEIHIQKMQERKAQLAEMGLNKMSRAEIMAQRAEDLADIFGDTKMRNFRE